MRTSFTFTVFTILLLPAFVFSQTKPKGSLTAVIAAIDTFVAQRPLEKVFLHIDKPYYTNTDTIWMKAYVLDGDLAYSPQSAMLYTELVNDTGKVVLRQSMPLLRGLGWNQMPLDEKKIPEGSYTLRAYTNWMQNQPAESFFTRQLFITKADENAWLINASSKQIANDEAGEIIRITDQQGSPVRLRNVKVKLTGNRKTLLQQEIQTDMDGILDLKFKVPGESNINQLNFVLEDAQKSNENIASNKKIVIPANINRPDNTDVQFMPESGQLVAGLTSKVGFKALGENGQGINIKGIIIDSKGQEITSFTENHQGMGYFLLTPERSEVYTAKIDLGNKLIKTYPLPVVKPSGIVLTVNNIPGRDSILISIQGTADVIAQPYTYSLIALNGENVCYVQEVIFNNKKIITGRVPKANFPSGIAQFTLLNDERVPIAERHIFIEHNDGLKIAVKTDKPVYQPKDSISFTVQVTDKDNQPIEGSFSSALTDDSQLKADSSNVPDIRSYMLLTGNLKGTIEQSGYYFSQPTAETAQQLDNLLLTQGWVAYDWTTIFDNDPKPLKFKPEKEISVSGRITNLSGKPVAKSNVDLLSNQKSLLFMGAVTDDDGNFIFRDLPVVDSASYLIKLKDNKRRVFDAQIKVDEFTPAATNTLPLPNVTPWYVNSNTVLLNYNRQNILQKKENDKLRFPNGAQQLKEVVIKGKKFVKGSHNLNGPGNADQVLDEEDLKKAKKLTLMQMLDKGMIDGFGAALFPLGLRALPKLEHGKWSYKIYDKKLRLVVDGTDVTYSFQPAAAEPTKYEEYNYLKSFMETITAEDIRGIEVSYNNRYSKKYDIVYLKPPDFDATGNALNEYNIEYVYLDITTWSGNGPFIKRLHNQYLYRPMPITWPKTFYKPKYAANTTTAGIQPTLYWQPDILTGKDGKATFTVNMPNKPGTYTLLIQGSDINGHVGVTRQKIVVK